MEELLAKAMMLGIVGTIGGWAIGQAFRELGLMQRLGRCIRRAWRRRRGIFIDRTPAKRFTYYYPEK